jgi:hypothetical protein
MMGSLRDSEELSAVGALPGTSPIQIIDMGGMQLPDDGKWRIYMEDSLLVKV